MKSLKKIVPVNRAEFVNDVFRIIYERRAIRKFKDLNVERNTIEQIIDAGRMAPSAINKQPWKFYVLTNKNDIKEFSKAIISGTFKGILRSGFKGILKTTKDFLHFSHGKDFIKEDDPIFHSAPVVIFITSPKDNEWAELDTGMCAQNMMLAAKSIGLESCPVGLAKFVEHTPLYPRLKIPGTEQVQLAVIIGYGNESPEAKDRIKNNALFL
ncbi:MAG: nitroreductase family protein [Bacteroidia bacterium]